MKRKDLIKFVEGHLEEIGFTRGAWLWQPRTSQLVVILGSTLKAISLKTTMTKRALTYEMGRLAGLAEAAGVVAGARANGHAKGNGVAQWGSATFDGLPA